MQIKIEKKVCVITPTIGKPEFKKALLSVRAQTYDNIQHLIVADGVDIKNFEIGQSVDGKVVTARVPFQTGANGFYGHRIYAAFPHLVDADYIFFLDEDNWYEPNHVESLVDILDQYGPNIDFAHSLRNVCQPDGTFIVEDCCESLGKWPIFFTQNGPDYNYLIDTSTFAFRREWLIKHCQHWHWGWGGDRHFFNTVEKFSHYKTSGLHTMNYRLDENMEKKYGSLDFFHKGNEIVRQHYGGKYPWI